MMESSDYITLSLSVLREQKEWLDDNFYSPSGIFRVLVDQMRKDQTYNHSFKVISNQKPKVE